MIEYPHIDSIFKRDDRGRFLPDYTCPEFDYLKDNTWIGTEKVDGTNIRIMWNAAGDGKLRFGGKTDAAQIPPFLLAKLQAIFEPQVELLAEKFPAGGCLYGEGYGSRIQKGGGNYNPSGVDFVLFDVRVDRWWLKRDAVEEVGEQFGLRVVPVVWHGSLTSAIDWTRMGFQSLWGEFPAEGLVLQPEVPLMRRSGERVITKVKTKDFR